MILHFLKVFLYKYNYFQFICIYKNYYLFTNSEYMNSVENKILYSMLTVQFSRKCLYRHCTDDVAVNAIQARDIAFFYEIYKF